MNSRSMNRAKYRKMRFKIKQYFKRRMMIHHAIRDDSIDKRLAYMSAFMERLDFIEVIDEPDFETRKLPDEIIALMNQDAPTEY